MCAWVGCFFVVALWIFWILCFAFGIWLWVVCWFCLWWVFLYFSYLKDLNIKIHLFFNTLREKAGDCVGNMIRVDEVEEVSEGQYLHFFQRRNGAIPGINLFVGDRVVVSGEENGLLGLATGYITEVNVTKVSCLLGR